MAEGGRGTSQPQPQDPQEPQDVERIVADLEAEAAPRVVTEHGDGGASTSGDLEDATEPKAADDVTDSVPGSPEPPD